jgi:hypothetical protein
MREKKHPEEAQHCFLYHTKYRRPCPFSVPGRGEGGGIFTQRETRGRAQSTRLSPPLAAGELRGCHVPRTQERETGRRAGDVHAAAGLPRASPRPRAHRAARRTSGRRSAVRPIRGAGSGLRGPGLRRQVPAARLVVAEPAPPRRPGPAAGRRSGTLRMICGPCGLDPC